MERVTEHLNIADIQQEVTRENYQEKFHKLLCWEEKEHIDILGNRLEFIIFDVSCTQREDTHLTKKLLTKAIKYNEVDLSICVRDLCEMCLYYIDIKMCTNPSSSCFKYMLLLA